MRGCNGEHPAISLACLTAQGFHKILKKHDKKLPHAPCMQFYVSHLHQQPWVQVTLLTICALNPQVLISFAATDPCTAIL